MDRYEYKLKTEQIQKLIARKEYKAALQIVETLDWRKEKDVRILSAAAEVYVANKQYSDAIDLLVQAYELAPIGRRVIYRLTEVAILAGETEAAESYLEEFREVAPGDSGIYILEYKLARLKKAPLEERIQILEKYQEQDFDEKWSYELAKLYEEAGRIDECVRLCDDIVLWFSLGKYVERALSLKAKHAPLTASQQDRINNPEIYQERFNEVREEMKRENDADSGAESADQTEEKSELLPGEAPETETEEKKTADELPTDDIFEEADGEEEDAETEELSETEAASDEGEPKGLRRVMARFFGIHEEELFSDDDLDDEEEEESGESRGASEEEIADAEPTDPAEEDASDLPEEDIQPETEDDTSWISQMVEETLQEAEDEEEQEEDAEWQEPVIAESASEEKEELLTDEAEAVSDEKPAQEEKKETLEDLLQDPTIRTAAETGDVFAATIREAEEEKPAEDEESDILEGQLEFDFTRLSAIEKVKEEREKELGIWDDPFRYLVMQEPEEEAEVRRILSGEEEALEQDVFATKELKEVGEIMSRIPDFTEEEEEPAESETEEEPEESEMQEAAASEEEVAEEPTEAVEEEATTEEVAEEPAEAVEEEVAEKPAEAVEEEVAEEPAEAVEEEATTEEVAEEPAEEVQPELAEHGIIEVTDVEVEDMEMPENSNAMDDIWRLLDEEEQALQRTEEEVQKALEEEPAFVLPDAIQPDAVAAEAVRAADAAKAAEMETETTEKAEEEEIPAEPEPENEAGPSEEETEAGDELQKAWSTHNIVVRSEDMKAGVELAMGYLMRLPEEERLPAVAKISGYKLNGKDWEDLTERLKDRILVIEEANAMDDDTMLKLRRYLTKPDHMAVMIDTEENIAEIGLRNKALLDMFPTEYAYYEYSVEEIVDHGLTYAAQKGWKLDDMAVLAYSASVEAIGEEQPGRELIEAENIMDDAIERAESGLFGGLFRKKDKVKILHENHFKQR